MDQKEKIRDLMRKKGIESDKELLAMILEKVKHTGNFSDLVEKEKGNFSKMLSGERNFKYEYIIEMEKIFEVPIAYIVGNMSYEQKQFTKKGLQYAAIINDYEQFVFLGNDKNKSGSPVIYNLDEYGKNLIDYIIEYDAVEGIRYLYNERQLKYCVGTNSLNIDNWMLSFSTSCAFSIAKLLIDKNEIELFNNIFDAYELLQVYNDARSVYFRDEFKELIIKNESVLESILNCREYPLTFSNSGASLLSDDRNTLVYFVNPLINVIYDYAIKNYNTYEKQVNRILEIGLKLNQKVLKDFEKKFPYIKDIKIPKSGHVDSNKINYTLIFSPETNAKGVSNQTNQLINENKEQMKLFLFKNGEAFSEKDETRLLNFIYRESDIHNRFRSNNRALNTIQSILEQNKISSGFRKNLSVKLKQFLQEKIEKLDKSDESYIQQYEELKWAMIFVELYEDKLNDM